MRETPTKLCKIINPLPHPIQLLLLTLRGNRNSFHGLEPPPGTSLNPALTTLFLSFRHTRFSFTQTCHHPVSSFKKELRCVDHTGLELVILLTPIPKYYLFFLKIFLNLLLEGGAATTAHMWRPKDNSEKPVVSLHLSVCSRIEVSLSGFYGKGSFLTH